MKRKTSITLFKLTFFPPISLLAIYVSLGLTIEGYAALFLSNSDAENLKSNILTFIKQFLSEREVIISYTYYTVVFVLFFLLCINFSFFGTILYFKTGFYKISPNEFHLDFVRRNKILFWDEYVDDTLGIEKEKTNFR